MAELGRWMESYSEQAMQWLWPHNGIGPVVVSRSNGAMQQGTVIDGMT